jgi:hypothetical protein
MGTTAWDLPHLRLIIETRPSFEISLMLNISHTIGDTKHNIHIDLFCIHVRICDMLQTMKTFYNSTYIETRKMFFS